MILLNTYVNKNNPSTNCCRISCISDLTGTEATVIREEIRKCITKGYQTIYLDTKEVTNADLSGINEVIHSAYTASNTNTQFILIYKSGSVVEKWVHTTGMDKFVETAIIPVS